MHLFPAYRRRCCLRLAFLPIALALSSSDSFSAPPKPLPIEALANMESNYSVALAPGGRWLATMQVALNLDYVDHPGNDDLRDAVKLQVNVIDLTTGNTMRVGPRQLECSNMVWSPDGANLAFQAGSDDQARLWVWTAETGETRQVSEFVPRRLFADPQWTPDGRHILIAVLPEGSGNDEVRKRTGATKTDADYPMDHRTPGARVALYKNIPAASRKVSGSATDRSDYASNNRYLGDLALIDIASGSAVRLVKGARPVFYHVSPDGHSLCYTETRGQAGGSGYRNLYDVIVAPMVSGGAARTLARDIPQMGIYMDFTWSPNSRWIAFTDSGPASKNQIHFIDVGTGKEHLTALRPRVDGQSLLAPRWDANSGGVYSLCKEELWYTPTPALTPVQVILPPGKIVQEILTYEEGGPVAQTAEGALLVRTRDSVSKDEGFYAVARQGGAARKLFEGSVHLNRKRSFVSRDGKSLVYSMQSAAASEQLWTSDLGFANPRQVSNMNPQLREYPGGKSRLVHWRGLDGRPMAGALLLPPDYDPSRRYPLVVYLYGGDDLSDDLNFFGFSNQATMPYENMQLLATRGYMVLRPATEIRIGTPMHDIAASMLPAIDQLVDQGLVDPERLGIMGRSYGGYSVLSVLVETQRFKAAIEVAGQATMAGVFSEMTPGGDTWKISWAEEHTGSMGGTLWDFRERYLENSPLYYFDRIKTPLLIVHGTNDTAVAIHQGDEIFQALRRLGREVEYAKYLDESHVISNHANSVDYANRMIDWFERHLDLSRDESGQLIFAGDRVKPSKGAP